MENKLWLIWKEPKSRRRYIIGLLTYEEEKYRFKYIDPELNNAKEYGFDFFPGFNDTTIEYESENDLFPNINSRLPNIARPDYLEILNTYELDITSTKMDILSKTKGRLLTDNFEFVPVFNKNKIEFQIAGTRYSTDIQKNKKKFEVNDSLILEREENNEYDDKAVVIKCIKNNKEYKLGYVPRYYAKELFDILTNNIEYSAKIKTLNFKSDNHDEHVTVDVKIIFKR